MKILILGAGATGGYFGGRLAAAGVDVTFLVRPRRAGQLTRDGLTIQTGDKVITTPVKVVTADEPMIGFDAVLLTAKSYDLQSAIAAIRPAIEPATRVLPLLNGMRHLDDLDAAFGAGRVLGGTCHISTTLTVDGVVRRMSTFDALTLGARDSSQADFARELCASLSRGGFETRLSGNAIGAMWEKWVLLATLAGMTSLMRATIGEIVATDSGASLISEMLDECCAIAAASGHAPGDGVIEATREALTDPKSAIAASMLRDIQRGSRIEADHIIGDLIARGSALGVPAPLLKVAFAHLQAYEARLDDAAEAG